ncbi:MAG: exopolyphosphatase [Ponticaulis sp.]|nr:exopolyphosphatase [Ponticaulis sp.]|tara:strand:- start:31176 stop:32711 length:1536 start_codon:yes stop_codon:yes gene_type:complete
MSQLSVETQRRPGLWRFAMPNKPRQQAVIDIGSNSVRLIVYQINGRNIVPRINEKVMAGLGEELAETGKLSPQGVESSLKALSRYTAICASLGVTNVSAIATAATRDAADGEKFCKTVEQNCGLKVRVLSGEEEAHYAALGVISAERDPTGLIGDLGGSSLELVEVKKGRLAKGKTYKLGPLALRMQSETITPKLKSYVQNELESRSKLPKVGRFFAVGGAWRAIASLHMAINDYPLRVLQSYSIPAKDAIDLCTLICDPKKRPENLIKSISSKRAASLHYTALALKSVLEACQAKEVVISAYGLREGLVFEGMDSETQKIDPLLAGVAILARSNQRQAAFSRSLQNFTSEILHNLPPVFNGDPLIENRLHEAAFILADMGAVMHPDHRSQIARQIVLRGAYTGLDHAGRAYLGLITATRYYRKYTPGALEEMLLTPEQIERAKTVALLIRLAAEFSGRTDRILKRASLEMKRDSLILKVQSRHKDLVSEGVEKRLGHVASQMDLKPVIET